MMRIGGFTPDQVVAFAEEGLSKLQRACKINRTGGYLALHDAIGTDRFLLICRVGSFPVEKTYKYLKLSQEKAERLFIRSVTGEISSFQSKNELEGMWGGAINSGLIIVSFSGLPELADEALSVYIAYRCGWIEYEEIFRITEISQNPYVPQILVDCMIV